jgi:flagellar hook-length control protein FliK
LALQAAQIATPTTATKPLSANAPMQSGAGAVFAALLAKLNPTPAAKDAPALPLAKDATKDTKIAAPKSEDDAAPNSDAAAALASLQAITPLQTQSARAAGDDDESVAQTGAVAPAKSGMPFADLKTIDPKDLKAAIPQPNTAPVKPGQPTLPVMPGHDADEGEETAATDPKGIDAKAGPDLPAAAKVAANAAQHLLRPATPAQTTEAQVVKPDIKQDNTDTGSGSGNTSGDQPKDDRSAQTATPHFQADAQQPAPHAQAVAHTQAAPQAAVQTTDAKPIANGIGAVAGATPTQTTQPAQPASLQISQAAPHASAQPDIAALAVNIAAKSQPGARHFDIRLDPPELGRIEVHLSVDDAGKAQAHLSADKPQTLDLLQRDSSSLTRALKESGVDLGNTGLSFSLRGQDREGGNAQKSFSRGRALSVSAVTEASASPSTISNLSSDRLDIRV